MSLEINKNANIEDFSKISDCDSITEKNEDLITKYSNIGTNNDNLTGKKHEIENTPPMEDDSLMEDKNRIKDNEDHQIPDGGWGWVICFACFIINVSFI